MSHLLRTGVVISAVIVFAGGVIYLFRHGFEPINYKIFQRVPVELCSVKGIWGSVLSFHGRGLIQLGLLLLIATPVARVFFSLITFVRQRNIIYIFVTAIVLAVLAHSLLIR
ncbi:MAG TPA: DUF1634 domain-containing protein [Candidatus Omnitrophota bacterium]|nr:DUF1634 domain-containing protein [Candidatus Omnitrophota bacterium]